MPNPIASVMSMSAVASNSSAIFTSNSSAICIALSIGIRLCPDSYKLYAAVVIPRTWAICVWFKCFSLLINLKMVNSPFSAIL